MISPAYIRSALFNLSFYILTAFACIVCLPTLVLPRKYFMGVVYGFVHTTHFLERNILGLKYEVRGAEHMPADGKFIVAAKHQSAYETLKLHILFNDPAVILKKELLSIPLWGLYLKKSDPIAIDRSSPDTAKASINAGALRMKEAGRPVLIFPQGTRVRVDQSVKDKPYKVGVARLQEATKLPILPLAMNSGVFWPRNSWFKASGTVIFEFLPLIEAGMERSDLMKKLETEIEETSDKLVEEAHALANDKVLARGSHRRMKTVLVTLGIFYVLLFGVYSYVWFKVADTIRSEYGVALAQFADPEKPLHTPSVTGFPGRLNVYVPQERFKTVEGVADVTDLRVRGWPIPNSTLTLETGAIKIVPTDDTSLEFDSLFARLNLGRETLHVHESNLRQGAFTLSLTGTADMTQQPVPQPDMMIILNNHEPFVKSLIEDGWVRQQQAMYLNAGLQMFTKDDGRIHIPLIQKKNTIYAGPIPVITLPQVTRYVPRVKPKMRNDDNPASSQFTPILTQVGTPVDVGLELDPMFPAPGAEGGQLVSGVDLDMPLPPDP